MPLVVAIGSGACNALDHLIRTRSFAGPTLAVDTDVHGLKRSKAAARLPLGVSVARGLGAGGDEEVGGLCARAERDALVAAFTGVDRIILVMTLGAGTGSGAGPVAAGIARELGAEVVAVVTRPWDVEGRRRRRVAEAALAELGGVEGLRVVIARPGGPHDPDASIKMVDAFRDGDEAVARAVVEALGAT